MSNVLPGTLSINFQLLNLGEQNWRIISAQVSCTYRCFS